MDKLEQHLRTVVDKTWNFSGRLVTPQDHLSNAIVGLAAEAGEVLDVMKKDLYHSPKNRRQDYVEEVGDVIYYLPKVMQLLDITMDEAMEYNRRKLFERHGVKR